MTTEHSPGPPSGAARIVQCAGSATMQLRYPESSDSEQAREGTAAHWALAEMLNGRAIAEGQITPENFVLTAEMVQGAELAVSWIRDVLRKHVGEMPQMFVEHRVYARRIHDHCWGTLDIALWFAASRTLYLPDYKFGRGWVEVFENWQLTCYLAGLLDLLQINGLDDQSTRVIYAIIQPRSYHRDGPIRTWELMASDARPLINRLSMAYDDAFGPTPTLAVGPECEHCSARHACPQLQANGLRSMDRARTAVPLDLPPAAAALELCMVEDAIAALDARRTGLAGQVQALLDRGEHVPFFASRREPGRLSWHKPMAEVLALGALLGVDLQKPAEAITPTQAKAKGLDDVIVSDYASRPLAPAKLVRLDNNEARKIFG